MAIISVTVTESSEQIVSGIPKSVAISTNIPATIFYTLDGTDPTIDSSIYTNSITLPTNLLKVELKIWATNGVLYSPVISEEYETDMLNNTKLPHSATDAQAGESLSSLYPFGTSPIQPNSSYLNPGDASVTVDNPDLEQIPNAYDGARNETAFTNEPYTVENYNIVYTDRDAEGQPSSGNKPGIVTIQDPIIPPEESQQFTTLFDPRAFVIFQDFTNGNLGDPVQVNREHFSFEDSDVVRDGNLYFNSGLDAPPVMGGFLRSHYNPRDNTITYYYYDSRANKWIISKTDAPEKQFDDLSSMVLSKNKGVGIVLEWNQFARRVLF